VKQAYLLRPPLFVLVVIIISPSFAEETNARPETAFLSPNQYTNAFFGFSLPLPTDPPFQEAHPTSGRSSSHVLLFVHALTVSFNYKPRLTALMISADESGGSPSDEVRRAAMGSESVDTKRIEIAGKEFWHTAWEEKDKSGKIQMVKYATAVRGYIVTFLITAFDSKLAARLERNIEQIKFFDPSKAQEIAGPASKPYQPSSSPQ
jgi:hypothetical protein